MILFLWNGSLSRKEWIWNIIEWNIIISRYLFLAAKLPHKELGTILINCLYFHLFEQKKNFTFQYCYDNNILTFTFLTTFSISVGHDHWTIFTFVIRSFSVPSLDIFRENPFWTVIWRTTWKNTTSWDKSQFTLLFWHWPKWSPLHSSFIRSFKNKYLHYLATNWGN